MTKLHRFDKNQASKVLESYDDRLAIGLPVHFSTQLVTLGPNRGHSMGLLGGILGH